MQFSFKNLIKLSWSTVWKYKVLWLFSIFIGGGSFFMNYNLMDEDWFLSVVTQGKELFLSLWFFLLLVGVIFLILFFISLVAKPALLQGISLIRKSEKIGFKGLFRFGKSKFKKMFLFDIIFIVINFILLSLFVLLVILKVQKILGETTSNVLILTSFILLFVVNLLIILFKHYSYCYLILEDNSVMQSIKAGWNLMRTNLKKTLQAYLIYLGLTIIFAIGVLLSSLILLIPLFLLGLFFSLLASPVIMPVMAIVGVVIILGLRVLLQGMFKVFSYRYLTEVYFLLKGLKEAKRG